MELHGLGRDFHSRFSGKELCHGCIGRIRDAIVFLPSGAAHEETGSLDLRLKVGHLELGVLELGDGFAKLLAFLRILNGLIHSTLSDTQSLRGDTDTAAVQGLHGDAEALAELAKEVFLRHFAVFENQLAGRAAADTHLQLFLADAEARHALLDDEGRDTLRAL